MTTRSKEFRNISIEAFELREDAEGLPTLVGYASKFGTEAVVHGWWRETVAKGAYKKTIQENDIRALWNHDPSIVLGRNKAKTLKLEEDDIGLRVEITPPDTQWGRDAVTSIKRGDVSQMSILFELIKQQWERGEDETQLPKRTILEAKLWEVSPVTFPVFEETEIAARSGLLTPQNAPDDLAAALRLVRCAERGLPLSDTDRAIMARAGTQLNQFMAAGEPDGTHHSPSEEEEPGNTHSTELRRQRLSLLAHTL